MNRTKKTRLEKAGWVVADTAQFLELSDEERRFVELKLALASGVRELRDGEASRKLHWRTCWGPVSRGWRRWSRPIDRFRSI